MTYRMVIGERIDMDEMDRRVAFVRLCLHKRKHYLDDLGNRRCFSCDAFVRDDYKTATIAAPDPT